MVAIGSEGFPLQQQCRAFVIVILESKANGKICKKTALLRAFMLKM